MKFKCPKCGSLNTTVTDYDALDKVLSTAQKNKLDCEFCVTIPPDAWAKIIEAIIKAAEAIIVAIIEWQAKKNTQPKKEKNFFVVCKDCHTVSKLPKNGE